MEPWTVAASSALGLHPAVAGEVVRDERATPQDAARTAGSGVVVGSPASLVRRSAPVDIPERSLACIVVACCFNQSSSACSPEVREHAFRSPESTPKGVLTTDLRRWARVPTSASLGPPPFAVTSSGPSCRVRAQCSDLTQTSLPYEPSSEPEETERNDSLLSRFLLRHIHRHMHIHNFLIVQIIQIVRQRLFSPT